MECEIDCIKSFNEANASTTTATPYVSIQFSIGITSAFYKNGKVIEDYQYKPIVEELDKKILDMSIKDRLETLWVMFHKALSNKFVYIKLKDGNITYKYRGHKMLEMGW